MKRYEADEFGFSWEYPELGPAERELRETLLRDPIGAVVPSSTHSTARLVRSMESMGIQARNLGTAYRILERMLTDSDRPLILLGLAGPLIAAGLRQVIREMIEYRLVDLVVSTGAILYQDIYQARGFNHFAGSIAADDRRLRDVYVNRIYNVYVDDIGFGATDSWIGQIADRLPPRAYSSREFMDHLADHLTDPGSIVRTCRTYGVPMFVPALNDSSIGIGLTEHRHRCTIAGRVGVAIDSIRDNYEIAQVIDKAPVTAAVFVAGGVPKNYINDAVVMSYILGQAKEGHRYAIQLSTAVTEDGGLSGSTLSEATSWWKMSPHASTAMVWAEPSIALPLLVSATLEEKLSSGRSQARFLWREGSLQELRFDGGPSPRP